MRLRKEVEALEDKFAELLNQSDFPSISTFGKVCNLHFLEKKAGTEVL